MTGRVCLSTNPPRKADKDNNLTLCADCDQPVSKHKPGMSSAERALVLAEHTLTPGGWECEGQHTPGSSPLWEQACSWNDCPELRRVLTTAEHTRLIETGVYPDPNAPDQAGGDLS